MQRLFHHINSHDIVVGLIADDKISDVYIEFLSGHMNSRVLSESLRLVKYGRQFVVKNQKYVANKYLKQLDCKVLSKEDRKVAKEWGIAVKKNMDANLEQIRKKYRRAEGSYFFDEVLDMLERGELYGQL